MNGGASVRRALAGGIVCLALGLGGGASRLCAQDEAPALVSRTGGGDTFSSVDEMAAAAAQGNLRASVALGELLWDGTAEAPRDRARALALLEHAARSGDGPAAFRIGMWLDDGEGVAADPGRALGYFRAAAAKGEMEAFHNIGVAYVKGRGVKRDFVEALAWLILARARGDESDVDEQLRDRLGRTSGAERIAAAERRSVEIERELDASPAERFLPPAGELKLSAGAADRRPAGASAGEKAAVGAGSGVTITTPTGRQLTWADATALERAAEQGDPVAMAALGQLLLEGKVLPENVDRAETWLERSAQAGNADAAAELADLYSAGIRRVRDDGKAFAYLQQAARGGAPRAIVNVGVFYANGRGTPRDYAAALSWLMVASHFGLDQGQEKRLREFLAKTQPAQIPEAESRAARWLREIEAARPASLSGAVDAGG